MARLGVGMSKDTLAFADFLTGLPRDADYDSVYAAVMASEAGRWFLGEYASRNRHADTQTLVGALARVEAAIRGEATPQTAISPRVAAPSQAPAPPEGGALSQSAAQSATVAPASCRDLIEIEAAINRVEALVAGWTNGPDSHRAVDRIHDIAFALREREFESALCDALDYAAREISAELNSADTAAQRAGAARELLHDLAGRVKDMIEMAIEIQKAQPPAALAVPPAAVEKQAAPSIEAKPAPTVVNVVGTVISSASAPPAGVNTSQMKTDTGATRESAPLAASLPDPPKQPNRPWRRKATTPKRPSCRRDMTAKPSRNIVRRFFELSATRPTRRLPLRRRWRDPLKRAPKLRPS